MAMVVVSRTKYFGGRSDCVVVNQRVCLAFGQVKTRGSVVEE